MESQREASVRNEPGLGEALMSGYGWKERHSEQRNDWRVGTEQKRLHVGSRGTVTSPAGKRLWKILTAA